MYFILCRDLDKKIRPGVVWAFDTHEQDNWCYCIAI